METAEVIRFCIGEWVVSIDLTDAYFYIPIHKNHKKLLKFHMPSLMYQSKTLPFGITVASL